MTWSIIARDASGAFGVAVASKFFAVGALCPHARSGLGALATQALLNPLFVAPGFEAMAQGTHPEDIVRTLTDADEGRDHRQLHMIDDANRSAAYTGAACIDWCGHVAGDGYSVAGNMLAGPQVVAYYAVDIIRDAAHEPELAVDKYLAAAYVGVVRVVGGVAGIFIIKTLPRVKVATVRYGYLCRLRGG